MSVLEMWTNLGTAIGSLMFAYAMFQQYFPDQLRERLKRSEVYTAIQSYLSANSSMRAKRLKADVVKDNQSVVLTMDDHEEITDDFYGIKIWWSSRKNTPRTQSFSLYPDRDERRYFNLTVHGRHRKTIMTSYIDHVIKEGKAISVKNRQRKLYTNNPSDNWYGWKATKWSHAVSKHPASFDTLAMATKMKEQIKNDLIKFTKGKDYYAKIGKAWKRGYLLFGPPGTGKTTMVAAMANFLNYDVYDLELTTVKDNSELRRLLIETTSKSIIVIEDIDCSLDLTGQRKPKKEKDDDEKDENKDPVSKKKKELEEEASKSSKVTLSGLLNFIDGIWSACGGERIIVFTTNYVEKLDPALIRRGRMDRHIEMSYCCFEAFKVLAKTHLDIDSHELFVKIEKLLEEVKMTPADVSEIFMPKSEDEDEDEETRLKNLVAALEEAKEEEARKKAEEEEKLKAEQEEKEKACKEQC
ncbi:hypothetical protein JCGZ_09695 [Jatropha curcas]|uniref:AAA+ ATPase domain-containing protein n=1 Tax=Jatropha curcas TaxID=180498 RepID=A0A067LAF6_JATCU|nr:hypothetical protein JCGZ_09695 [Jatropha curcas]